MMEWKKPQAKLTRAEADLLREKAMQELNTKDSFVIIVFVDEGGCVHAVPPARQERQLRLA